MNDLLHIDKDIFDLIAQEESRQRESINLIASENSTWPAVQEAVGSVLTNKYAEGYPGKRYYGGCEIVDRVEKLAIERCKEIFGAEYVNVQPHSGSSANWAVFFAMLRPGDTVMGMDLSAGGHLTHGHKANFSGALFNCVSYSVDRKTECIDYEEIERVALETKPRLLIAGASAYSRNIDFERFSWIAKKVGAYLLADIAHIAGLVAVGLHQNPFPHADFVTSTTHKTLRGPRGGLIMAKAQFARNLDTAVMPGIQGGPLMHVIAGKAVAFKQAMTQEFKTYQKNIVRNAQAMAEAFKRLGYRIVTGGTNNHLFIVDLCSKGITGKQAENALELAGIIVSRSCIPYDEKPAYIASGIRIGTPDITTKGAQEQDVREIALFIAEALDHSTDKAYLVNIRTKSVALCRRLYCVDDAVIIPAVPSTHPDL